MAQLLLGAGATLSVHGKVRVKPEGAYPCQAKRLPHVPSFLQANSKVTSFLAPIKAEALASSKGKVKGANSEGKPSTLPLRLERC